MIKGRISRSVYFVVIATMVAFLVVLNRSTTRHVGVSEIILIFLAVPRLHDIGRSGWLVLWGVAIEIVGLVASFALLPSESVAIGLGLTTLVLGAIMVVLGLIPGDKGPNKYGEESPALWRRAKQNIDVSDFD